MNQHTDPLQADREFFEALIGADTKRLGEMLVEDFVLIDVMSGSEVSKEALLAVIDGGELVFEAIKPAEGRVRQYGEAAVVTGRTRMRGTYGGAAFEAASRYTHVYVQMGGVWKMASAQGTKIAEA